MVKKGLFMRVIAFIVVINFIFTSIPFSRAIASDSLRPKAASNTITQDYIVRDLKNLGTDGGSIGRGGLTERLIVEFSEIGKEDVSIAGGKGANLGELQKVKGISVPPGVVITTKAFKLHIDKGTVEIEEEGKKITLTLRDFIQNRLKGLNYDNSEELALAGKEIRKKIVSARMPEEVETAIRQWYQRLCERAGIENLPIAVRSSATAEDLPDASFAGQQDTYLNIRGIEAVLDGVKRNWASLFTDRAIFYRYQHNIDHSTAYISVILQQMIESRVAGTAFSVHTDTGFPSITIDAAPGLGEGIVSGAVNPDSWIVAKDSSGNLRIYRRVFGKKRHKVVYRKGVALTAKEGTELVETTDEERQKFSLTDRQVIQVARAVEAIHNHYGDYMDIEWGIDEKGKLWIFQARAETVWRKWNEEHPHTVRMENKIVPEELLQSATVLLSGISGSRAASGKVVIVDAEKTGTELAKELDRVKQGDILVTTMTRPDMVPAMRRAGAIVTDEGGPTCHAAIVARELGIPAIVGTAKATKVLKEGMEITVDANRGKVYAGTLKIVELKDNVYIRALPVTKTKIGVIIASPLLAMRMQGLSEHPSHYGVGLLRKEFADTTEILIHPLAGLAYDRYYNDPTLGAEQKKWIKEKIIDNEELRQVIEDTIRGYPSFEEFYKDKLANAIALIAASVAKGEGQRVKFRTTDFKTNEYREQIGGPLFEPVEKNPMMGYRGINRMLSEAYRRAFELEIEAIKQARELQKNIDVMFPVVRTPEELKEAIDLLAKHGLVRGKDGFQIGMMVEVPSNVFQAEEFYRYVDFMSIGSNDLTQFILGLGRDNEKMRRFFDEANPAVKRALEIVIKQAKQAKPRVTSGFCGQKPSNDPGFAAFLVRAGIDSISVVGEVYKKVVEVVSQQEKELEGQEFEPTVSGWEVPEKEGNPQRIISKFVDANGIIITGGIHPQILLRYERGEITDENLKRELTDRLKGKSARDYVIDEVYTQIMQQVSSTPKDMPIIYMTESLDKTIYETLLGGQEYELFDENPQLGFCGLARVTDPDYQEFFRWQLEGIKKAREDSGRQNIGIRLNLVRTLDEVNKALHLMKTAGLTPGKDGFMVGMEIAIPSNVLLINEFIKLGLNFLVENNERFLHYNLAIDPDSPYVSISDKSKENALKVPRRVLTNAAEKNKIPLLEEWQAAVAKAEVDGGTEVKYLGMAELLRALETAIKESKESVIESLVITLHTHQENEIISGFVMDNYSIFGNILPSDAAIKAIEEKKIARILNGFKEKISFSEAIEGIKDEDFIAKIYYLTNLDTSEESRLIVLYPTPQGLKKRLASASEEKVYTAFANEEWNGFVDSLPLAKAVQAALVIDADTVLKNAGTISALRQIQSLQPNLEIVVWTTEDKQVQVLKDLGVDKIASIELKELDEVLAELQNKGIPNELIVLINSEGKLDIKGLLKDKQGITAFNLKAPKAKEESSINAMPLVVARAVTQVLKAEDVTQQYQKLSNAYVKNNLISEEDLNELNNFDFQICTVPLVKVSEDVAKAQVTYETIMSQI